MIRPVFSVLALGLVLVGCSRGEHGEGTAMDSNMAARADAMDSTANARANQIAGDIMANAAEPPADNGANTVTP